MSSEEQRRLVLLDTGLINWTIFSEIVAMDEDEEGFSKSIFITFVNQALQIFNEINENLNSKEYDLEKISSLGHYLKGSAAALGLKKIQSECERIQNYGIKTNFDDFDLNKINQLNENELQLRDADNNQLFFEINEDSDPYWIKMIENALLNANYQFKKTKIALDNYFEMNEDDYNLS